MLVSVCEVYGSLRPGLNYTATAQKNDYVVIRHRGKLIHVPSRLVKDAVSEQEVRNQLQTYQEVVNDDYGFEEEEYEE